MIKTILFTVAIALLPQSQIAFALVAGPAKIKGVVKSFDEKHVVVESEVSKFEIPKDYIAEKNLKAGSKIEVTLSQEQVDKIKVEKKKSLKK